jgi:hypothetical protein
VQLLPDYETPELESLRALHLHRRQLSTKVRLFLDIGWPNSSAGFLPRLISKSGLAAFGTSRPVAPRPREGPLTEPHSGPLSLGGGNASSCPLSDLAGGMLRRLGWWKPLVANCVAADGSHRKADVRTASRIAGRRQVAVMRHSDHFLLPSYSGRADEIGC